MHADGVAAQLVASLSRRDARGCQLRAEKMLLPACAAFGTAHESTGPLRAQRALEWACQASAPRGPSGAARRLSLARRFLLSFQAAAPDTAVPAPGLLPPPRRPKPSLFTPTPLTALFEAAQTSRPRGSWRPHTRSSLLGLLASPGLRRGEAIR